MKVICKNKIDQLIIELADKQSPELIDISQVLMKLNPGSISKLYLSPIYIAQKTDLETVQKMLKQVELLSDHDGKYPSIQIAECKHQVKFLDCLFALFQCIKKCDLIVTHLKFNNNYFDFFFKSAEQVPKRQKEKKKLTISHLTVANETDYKNKFALEYILKNLSCVKSIEVREVFFDKKGAPGHAQALTDQACYMQLCKASKAELLHLKLDGVRFESLRDLTLLLDELNQRLMKTLDILKIRMKPNDYDNLEHYYYVLGRFKALRSLSIPVIEHKLLPSCSTVTMKLFNEKLKYLNQIHVKVVAPLKMPSEQSTYLYLLVKDLICNIPQLRKVTFESEYLLLPEQLKKCLSSCFKSMDIDYSGCTYEIGDILELRKTVIQKHPWISLKIH